MALPSAATEVTEAIGPSGSTNTTNTTATIRGSKVDFAPSDGRGDSPGDNAAGQPAEKEQLQQQGTVEPSGPLSFFARLRSASFGASSASSQSLSSSVKRTSGSASPNTEPQPQPSASSQEAAPSSSTSPSPSSLLSPPPSAPHAAANQAASLPSSSSTNLFRFFSKSTPHLATTALSSPQQYYSASPPSSNDAASFRTLLAANEERENAPRTSAPVAPDSTGALLATSESADSATATALGPSTSALSSGPAETETPPSFASPSTSGISKFFKSPSFFSSSSSTVDISSSSLELDDEFSAGSTSSLASATPSSSRVKSVFQRLWASRSPTGKGDFKPLATDLAQVPQPPQAQVPSSTLGGSDAESADWEAWSNLLVNWDANKKSKADKVKKLVRKGIPAPLRGFVWQHLSHSIDKEYASMYLGLLVQDSPHEKLIRRDIARTFPAHSFFTDKEGLGQEALFNVLKAYAVYDHEVGYCQGTPFVVGMLLMQMPEEEAFGVLAQLMHEYGLRELYKPSMAALTICLYQLERLLEESLPNLHAHLASHAIQTSMFASQWFLTLFATTLPLPAALRVVDVFMAEGLEWIFRVALGILKDCEDELLAMDFEQVVLFFSASVRARYSEDSAEKIVAMALDASVSRKQLAKYEKDFVAMREKEAEELEKTVQLTLENKELLAKVTVLEKENGHLLDQLAQSRQAEQSHKAEIERLKGLLQLEADASAQLHGTVQRINDERLRLQKEVDDVLAQLVRVKIQFAESEFSRGASGHLPSSSTAAL